MRTSAWLTAAVASAALAACSGSSRIDLSVFDPEVAAPLVAGTGTAPAVHVGAFTLAGAGPDPRRIGTARTGISDRHASVLLGESPVDLLTRTLERAFEDAGLRLVDAGAAAYTVAGTIERFTVRERHDEDVLQTCVAEVSFEASVTALGGGAPRTVLTRRYDSEAVSYPALNATKYQQEMVEQAVTESVQALLDDPDLWHALGVSTFLVAPGAARSRKPSQGTGSRPYGRPR